MYRKGDNTSIIKHTREESKGNLDEKENKSEKKIPWEEKAKLDKNTKKTKEKKTSINKTIREGRKGNIEEKEVKSEKIIQLNENTKLKKTNHTRKTRPKSSVPTQIFKSNKSKNIQENIKSVNISPIKHTLADEEQEAK